MTKWWIIESPQTILIRNSINEKNYHHNTFLADFELF